MSATAPLSEARLNANRLNSEHSTGPRTGEGKKRTRLNGLRHGLTGQTVVMPHEDRDAWRRFCADTVAALQPVGDAESALAQTIADDSWRLNRARAIEENIFALDLATETACDSPDADYETHQALTQAMTFLDHAREIQLLTLYAGRIARTVARNKAELKALQAERNRARQAALEEVLLLAQLAQSKGQTYKPATDPHRDGFGFSASEINRILDRRARLAEAISLSRTLRKAA